jgi:hypothetical protein
MIAYTTPTAATSVAVAMLMPLYAPVNLGRQQHCRRPHDGVMDGRPDCSVEKSVSTVRHTGRSPLIVTRNPERTCGK